MPGFSGAGYSEAAILPQITIDINYLPRYNDLSFCRVCDL